MEDSEKKIRQEDCNEDTLGAGILTLTNKRIAFEKKFGETVLNVPLEDVTQVWKEGRLMKKVCIKVKTDEGEKSYKFGVFSTGSWLETMQETLEKFKN